MVRANGAPLRPEQKSLVLLQEVIVSISQSGDLVVDPFAGTYSTAVACLTILHDELRRFLECEADLAC